MSDKVLNFIRIVDSQFTKRHESEDMAKIWLKSMVQGLDHYDRSILERAAYRIINTREGRSGYPKLADCREACDFIVNVEKAREIKPLDSKENAKAFSPDWAFKQADELICAAPIGKQAAREGWILSLHDFCRLNGRLPTAEFEIRACIKSAKGFDEAFEAVLNGNGGAMTKALERLGDAMLKKREKYRSMALGGKE